MFAVVEGVTDTDTVVKGEFTLILPRRRYKTGESRGKQSIFPTVDR
jgi:hypothetical protein